MASYDVASNSDICQTPALAHHVIQRILNLRFLNYMASYDVVRNICGARLQGAGRRCD